MRPAAPEDGSLARVLLDLGVQSLAEGDLAEAESRFRRLLAADPGSVGARVGLGRVALARGRLEEAGQEFAAARARDPRSVAALLGSAEVAEREGDRDAARRALVRALESDATNPEIHARLSALLGPAPRPPELPDAEGRRLAQEHPYDPWALLRAGEAHVRAGEEAIAIARFERAVGLADLDRASAEAALERLTALDPDWRARRVVPVYAFVDATLRRQPGWRFQQRALWQWASETLDPLLATRFVPVFLGGFDVEPGTVELLSVHARLVRATVRRPPPAGIVAAFTGIPPPERPGPWKLGLADFLGRSLTVRVEPGGRSSRVLVHELLHLYGGVHVAADVESLMNPESAEQRRLDPLNQRIVRGFRERTFTGGGLERDVIPFVDLRETLDAYRAAVSVNLTFRRLGVAEALEEQKVSRYRAAERARQVVSFDPHLADVARTLATFLLIAERRAEAVMMLDTATTLYGPRTPEGRATFARAEAIRRRLAAELAP